MLSILIPIFNQDVRPMVYTLAKQCNKLKITYQILCFDDCSDQKFKEKNKELAMVVGINYTELPENLGRSKIRNWLGKAAYYENLLFLDGDTAIKNKDFIKNYLAQLPTEAVIYGGREYSKQKPKNGRKVLHWKYGRFVESLPPPKRQKNPYLSFMSNNFLIPEKIFKQCMFDENTKGYGYEDLQYAERLKKIGIEIVHIHNPAYHEGLELNHIFMSKAKNAINNLILLESEGKIPETRIIRTYQNFKSWNLINIVIKIIRYFKKSIEKNLLSPNPNLLLLQLWKLEYYDSKIKNSL